MPSVSSYVYQVGGSLPIHASSYVTRQADTEFYQALKVGDFCYVLNSRQMGKSSLRVQIMQRLQEEGVTCAFIDLSGIGRQGVTPDKWYAGLVNALVGSCQLNHRINWRQWWRSQQDVLSPLQCFHQFIDDVLLPEIPGQIVIFIDEIDRVLSQDFALDDFFVLIRSFYNRRVDVPAYNRLTFALLGVATPSDLIADKTQTPFNIGHAIALHGFTLQEAQPLSAGLVDRVTDPQATLEAILSWTGGQPFLTQKLCQLIVHSSDHLSHLPDWVDSLVQTEILENWEEQDEPEHLRTVRDRLLRDPNRLGQLLGLYQQTLQQGQLDADNSPEQTELRLSGLVIKQGGQLQVANRIYQTVFNLQWVERVLQDIRPYGEAIAAWLESDRLDESRLLRGQALQSAITWKMDKQVSSADNDFLAASQALDKQLIQKELEVEQQAKQVLQAANQEAEGKIRAANRRLTIGSVILAIFLGLAAITGIMATQARQEKAIAQREKDELEVVIQSLDATRSLEISPLLSLLQSLQTTQRLKELERSQPVQTETRTQVTSAVQQAVRQVREYNQLIGHSGRVKDVQFSPDGTLIASASDDKTIRLWTRSGTLVKTLKGHQDSIWIVRFSPDGKTLASASDDHTIKFWNVETGHLIRTIQAHEINVRGISFSPDGQQLASVSSAGDLKLWNVKDGSLIWSIQAHSKAWATYVTYSPNGQMLATTSWDGTVKLWTAKDGRLLKTLKGHQQMVRSASFSPGGKYLISTSEDHDARLWNVETGQLIELLAGHRGTVWRAVFLPEENLTTLMSAGEDGTIKRWNLGRLLHREQTQYNNSASRAALFNLKIPTSVTKSGQEPNTFSGHRGRIWSLALSPDGTTLASAGSDKIIRLWRVEGKEPRSVLAHKGRYVQSVEFSPDGTQFASAGEDAMLNLWNVKDRKLRLTLPGHYFSLQKISFNRDGTLLAAAGLDHDGKNWHFPIKIWRTRDGQLLHTLRGHRNAIREVRFSPDGNLLASASVDKTVQLWQVSDGKPLRTFKGHKKEIWGISFNPEGTILASASHDRTAILWDVASGNKIRTLQGHISYLSSVEFSPDGKTLATGSDDTTIRLWRVADGKMLNVLEGHGSWVRGLDFSSDGKQLASASSDKTVKIWQVETGKVLSTLSEHSDQVEDVSFNPDGTLLASASRDGTVKLWRLNLDLDKLVAVSCDWLQDYLGNHPEEKDVRSLCTNQGN